jgi:hypothetical protein
MTTKLADRHPTFLRLTTLLACVGLTACAAEDDDGDTNASASLTTSIGSDPTNASEATEDPTNGSAETGTTDPSAGTEDTGPADTGTTDPTAETGNECTAMDECIDDSMCAGGMCIGCICVGGGETGTGECGTNVSTMNAACDDCTHANCCPEVQGCFGDETVMGETPCLQLNNCIAMSCGTAMTLEDLQMCIEMNCPDLAGELETFLMFNACAGMNCAAECAG